MKPAIFLAILLSSFSAFGQISKNNKPAPANLRLTDTAALHKNISSETCNCVLSAMKDRKPSAVSDSCYQAMLSRYKSRLKQLGLDPAKQEVRLKLSNEIVDKMYRDCPGFSRMARKEYENEQAKKLLFKGTLVSQAKRAGGGYEIVMKDTKTGETKVFYATNPLNESQVKKYRPGYELTLEYEIVKNRQTGKDVYFLKEPGTVMSIGTIEVGH